MKVIQDPKSNLRSSLAILNPLYSKWARNTNEIAVVAVDDKNSQKSSEIKIFSIPKRTQI